MLQGMGAKLGFLHTTRACVYLAAAHGCQVGPWKGPYRLVVRTSRCGRNNPGSTPGEDMHYTD